MAIRTALLGKAIESAIDQRPFELRLWDGTTIPASQQPFLRVEARSPAAIRHMLWAPGELGAARAFVRGDLEIDDLDALFDLLNDWQPEIARRGRAKLIAGATLAAGRPARPAAPELEAQLDGERHSRQRDADAVSYHYDVSNEFFAMFLDESMTYSCAIFSQGAETLEDAQRAKHELICRKLDLKPGDRLLDVGCGWAAFAIHAVREHGAQVLGITLSSLQADRGRERVDAAGLSDQIEIRHADFRDMNSDESFEAIASVGMVEHVGEEQIDTYAQTLASLLKPGGRLLNHGIAWERDKYRVPGPFSDRYVFPDGDTLPARRIRGAFESAGLVFDHDEVFQDDYAQTLTHWLERLEANQQAAIDVAGEERVRAWRLYLRGSRNAFRQRDIAVHQLRFNRPA